MAHAAVGEAVAVLHPMHVPKSHTTNLWSTITEPWLIRMDTERITFPGTFPSSISYAEK
jgi:hypothetical protein